MHLAAIAQPGRFAQFEPLAVNKDAILALQIAHLVGTVDTLDFGVVTRGELIFKQQLHIVCPAYNGQVVHKVKLGAGLRPIQADKSSESAHDTSSKGLLVV